MIILVERINKQKKKEKRDQEQKIKKEESR